MLNHMLRAASGNKVDVNFLQTASNTANQASYTFTSQNLGAAFSGRGILVGVSQPGLSGQQITAVTVGGVSGTLINQSGGTTSRTTALFLVNYPTGTSADVVITMSATTDCCGIALWSISNFGNLKSEAKPNAINTSNSAASQTWTFTTVKRGDAIVVMSRIRSANVGTYSMTGATERFEETTEATVSGQFGGDTEITSNQSNYNVVISTSGASPITNSTVTRFYL